MNIEYFINNNLIGKASTDALPIIYEKITLKDKEYLVENITKNDKDEFKISLAEFDKDNLPKKYLIDFFDDGCMDIIKTINTDILPREGDYIYIDNITYRLSATTIDYNKGTIECLIDRWEKSINNVK